MPDEMRRVGYVPNHRSFGMFMRSEQARKPALEAAQAIVEIARADAARFRSRKKGDQHFADRFKINKRPPHKLVGRNRRAIVEVFNDSDHAAPVEFGSPATKGRGRHTLRRAGSLVGQLRGDV